MCLEQYNEQTQKDIDRREVLQGIIGDSPKLRQLKHIDDRDVRNYPELAPYRDVVVRELQDSGKYTSEQIQQKADAVVGYHFSSVQKDV